MATVGASSTWTLPNALRLVTARPLWLVMAGGLLIRLFLAGEPGNTSDLTTLERWSFDLGHEGPLHFYDGPVLNDYLPGYLYVLWLIGLAQRLFEFQHDTYMYVLKLPSIAADLASAYVLYLLLAEKPQPTRVLAAAAYLALPPVLFIGALWGQVDSLLSLSLLLCVYLLSRGRPATASVAFTVGFLTKPQALAALPILVFWGLRDYPPRAWIRCVVAAAVASLIIVWPFFPTDPWNIVSHTEKSANVFGHSSSFAFNLWGMWGWFRDDNLTYYWIDWRYWGFFLNAISTLFIIYSLRNARGPGMLALGVGLSMLAFFVFQTRMHERYMFASLPLLLAACFYLNRPLLWVSFALLSLLQFLSLYKAFYHPFFNAGDPAWLYGRWVLRMIDYSPSWWHRPGTFTVWLCSLTTTLTLLVLMAHAFLLHHRVRVEPELGDDARRLRRDRMHG